MSSPFSSEQKPVRLQSRQWSCSSLQSALQSMDAQDLLAALPEDPRDLAALIQDTFKSDFEHIFLVHV